MRKKVRSHIYSETLHHVIIYVSCFYRRILSIFMLIVHLVKQFLLLCLNCINSILLWKLVFFTLSCKYSHCTILWKFNKGCTWQSDYVFCFLWEYVKDVSQIIKVLQKIFRQRINSHASSSVKLSTIQFNSSTNPQTHFYELFYN